MRVVHLSFHCDTSGRDARALLDAWPTLTGHALAIRRAGGDVRVLQAATFADHVTRDGVPIDFIPVPPSRWARPEALFAALRAASPEVVHLHGFVRAPWVASLRREVPTGRIAVQDHGGRAPVGVRRLVWRFVLRGMTVAATSRVQAEAWGAARAVAIPEASTDMTPLPQDAARAQCAMAGRPAVLWLGRLDDNKDPLAVLAAVRRAASRAPDLRLWMAWLNGPLEGEVRRRIAADPDLARRVTLLGRISRDEVRLRLSASDVFVQASRREVCGYALLEALACGTPAVVSDIPPFRALMGDPPAGALVPLGDAAALADALVAPHPSRATVRAHFERHLSWDVLGRQWLSCYRELAAR